MGRWSYSERYTVEGSKSITIQFLCKKGYFNGGIRHTTVYWYTKKNEQEDSVDIEISTIPEKEYIKFEYESKTCADIIFISTVKLTSTACNFGGLRWWFICPDCGRRVCALFKKPDIKCRHCFNLTYESSKESHKFDRLFRCLGMTEKEAKEELF